MNTLREHHTPGGGATAPGAVVLRDLGTDRLHRYATHWRNDQDGGFYWGHYFKEDELGDANRDFDERAARGF
jgi:hypothetical protein